MLLAGGEDTPGITGGAVGSDGEETSHCNDRHMTALRRRKIGFIFQAFNLLPNLPVLDNICLPLFADGQKPDPKLLHELAERLGIADKLRRRPGSLSALTGATFVTF